MQLNIFKIFYLFILVVICFSACKSSRVASVEKKESEPREVSQLEQIESTVRMIDAGKQKMLGNTANAIVLYAEAVKRDPGNSAAFFELAKIHAQQGHLKDAERFALKAVSLEPENLYYQLALADIFFLQEKNQDALKIQQMIAEKNPNKLNLQLSLFSSYVYMEMYDQAIELLNHIEVIGGFNEQLSIQKQKLLLEQGHVELAIEEAKKLISYFPDEMLFQELLAELYAEAGKIEEAYDIYKYMLEVQPDNAMARLLLADYYARTDQPQKAYEELLHAFRSPDLEVEAKSRIMYTFYQLSEDDQEYLDQAYALCEVLVEVHPKDAQAQALYGDFLMRDDKLEQAREKFAKSAEIEPSELGFWQQMLVIDSTLGNYQDMLETSDKALEYFFEHAVLYLFNGIANFQLKNYQQAIAAFDYGKNLALDNKELYAQFLTLLGDTHYKADDYEASFKSYQGALRVDPKNTYALNNYSYYLSLRNEELEKALEMSAKANDLDPDNASYQDTYGWINYKMGNYEVAKVWIKKALNSSEKPGPTVLEHYGDVLYKLGEKEKALMYWEKALNSETDGWDVPSEFLEKKVKEKTLYE